MDMEIEKLAKASRLQVSDPLAFIMRMVRPSADRLRPRPAESPGAVPQPLPMLDWPPNLFDNEMTCH
jgi:hypothetical protein